MAYCPAHAGDAKQPIAASRGRRYQDRGKPAVKLPTKRPSSTPYWWETAPLPPADEQSVAQECDTVVVGAGYTGLSAAIVLARAGRSVQVFDRQRPGEGASTRNGGITSGNVRPSYSQIERRFGRDRAEAILLEGKAARDDLYRFIAEERIDCDFALTGRFIGAMGRRDYDKLAREADFLAERLGIEAFAVPRAKQHDWLGTDLYHGGAVRMDIGGLHPAKLCAGMLRAARSAGATVHGLTRVAAVRPDSAGWTVSTARGDVRTRDVVVATNGYADGSDRWLRRRLVPVRSRIIATERLPEELMARLMPRRAMCTDTRALSYYYRPSPDGQRILFGGRDGSIAGQPDWPTEHLKRRLSELFPECREIAVTHSWFGHVAMNRDMLPRLFSHDGQRYGVGYCGSGVVWARWIGQKLAWQILGDARGATAFDFRPPGAVPLYNGTPWFMPLVFAKYKVGDWLSGRRQGAG